MEPPGEAIAIEASESSVDLISAISAAYRNISPDNAYDSMTHSAKVAFLNACVGRKVVSLASGMNLLEAPRNQFQEDVSSLRQIVSIWSTALGVDGRGSSRRHSISSQGDDNEAASLCSPDALQAAITAAVAAREEHEANEASLSAAIGCLSQPHGCLQSLLSTSDVPVPSSSETQNMPVTMARIRRSLEAAAVKLKSEFGLGLSPPESARILACYRAAVEKVEDELAAEIERQIVAIEGNLQEQLKIMKCCGSFLQRPRVALALKALIDKLLQAIMDDLALLNREASAADEAQPSDLLCDAKGVPRIAGAVMRLRLISLRLNSIEEFLQASLGPRWQQDPLAGRVVRGLHTAWVRHDADEVVQRWLRQLEKSKLTEELQGPIFEEISPGNSKLADALREGSAASLEGREQLVSHLKLQLRFREELHVLSREVRSLRSLGVRIPHALLSLAFTTSQLFSAASIISRALLNFTNCLTHLPAALNPFIFSEKDNVLRILSEGMDLEWEDEERLDDYAALLSSAVADIEERGIQVKRSFEKLTVAITNLKSTQDIPSCLLQAQVCLNMLLCPPSVASWAADVINPLLKQAEQALLARLQAAVRDWVHHMLAMQEFNGSIQSWENTGEASASPLSLSAHHEVIAAFLSLRIGANKMGGSNGTGMDGEETEALRKGGVFSCVEIQPIAITVREEKGVILLQPSLEQSSHLLLRSLEQHMASIVSCPKLHMICGNRSDQGTKESSTIDHLAASTGSSHPSHHATYSSLISQLPASAMAAAHAAVDLQVERTEAAVQALQKKLAPAVKWTQQGAIEAVCKGREMDAHSWQIVLDKVRGAKADAEAINAVEFVGAARLDASDLISHLTTRCHDAQSAALQLLAAKCVSASAAFLRRAGSTQDLLQHCLIPSASEAREENQEEAAGSLDLADESGRRAAAADASHRMELLRTELQQLQQCCNLLNKHSRLIHKGEEEGVVFEAGLKLEAAELSWEQLVAAEGRVRARMERQQAAVRRSLLRERSEVKQRFEQVWSEWEEEKQRMEKSKPSSQGCLETASYFHQMLDVVENEAQQVIHLMHALHGDEKEEKEQQAEFQQQLEDLRAELHDYSSRWDTLSKLADVEREARRTLVTQLKEGEMSRSLEHALMEAQEMQAREKSSSNRSSLVQIISGLRSCHQVMPIINQLAGILSLDRHFSALCSALAVDLPPFLALTVGYLIDAGIAKREGAVQQALARAAGEASLEAFLNKLEREWEECNLVLAAFRRDGSRLIVTNLDDVMETLKEHGSLIADVTSSPHFKPYAERIIKWEERLSSLAAIADKLRSIQTQWAHLEGVFSSTAVQQQLLAEFRDFSAASSAFDGVMRRVQSNPKALQLLRMRAEAENEEEGRETDTGDRGGNEILVELEGTEKLLADVGRRVHGFLDQQRARFPRLFLLGDEAMLEILSAGSDVSMVLPHLHKMFNGIQSCLFDAISSTQGHGNVESAQITAVVSPEGEEVYFENPVLVGACAVSSGTRHSTMTEANKSVTALDWLPTFEAEVQSTLFCNLATVVADMAAADWPRAAVGLKEEAILQWILRFPMQVLLLALQIRWTDEVDKVMAASMSIGEEEKEKERKERSRASASPTSKKMPEESNTPPSLQQVLISINATLQKLAGLALSDAAQLKEMNVAETGKENSFETAKVFKPLLARLLRRRLEAAVTVLVHQRDVLTRLMEEETYADDLLSWQCCMRFYFDGKQSVHDGAVTVRIADASFQYGFEYSGMAERLVFTPLTTRCFLSLSQALRWGQGGALIGPAGTGKTETVKALGSCMGRPVVVFSCDSSFDAKAMTRILGGLARIGAWGCFDEFNRLDEANLSVVSQHLLAIQYSLHQHRASVLLSGMEVPLHPFTGVFVTLNPDYAGREHLPENLRQLLRHVAMVRPDASVIAEVQLFAHGFQTARQLAGAAVDLLHEAERRMSKQVHYDFSLRALKAALHSAHAWHAKQLRQPSERKEAEDAFDVERAEGAAVVRGLWGEMAAKMGRQDAEILLSLISEKFPGIPLDDLLDAELAAAVTHVSSMMGYVASGEWLEKVLHLSRMLRLHHGVMLVGPPSGKTAAWKALAAALNESRQLPCTAHVLNPKALTKEELFGRLDVATREWHDGAFTSLLRSIAASCAARSESKREGSMESRGQEREADAEGRDRSFEAQRDERGRDNRISQEGSDWIIFDGEVDPLWIETMNSLLDDSKILTLPNGERIRLPSQVRIMFECSSLANATPATISRLGIVCFSSSTLPTSSLLHSLSFSLQQSLAKELSSATSAATSTQSPSMSPPPSAAISAEAVQDSDLPRCFWDPLAAALLPAGLIEQAVEAASMLRHVMPFQPIRVLYSFLALLMPHLSSLSRLLLAASSDSDRQLVESEIKCFLPPLIVHCMLWGMGSAMDIDARLQFAKRLSFLLRSHSQPMFKCQLSGTDLLSQCPLTTSLEWSTWQAVVQQQQVPTLISEVDDGGTLSDASEFKSRHVSSSEFVVPTSEVMQVEALLRCCLLQRRLPLLCGPPGSGKTLLISSVVQKLHPEFSLLSLSFSQSTTVATLLNCLEEHCDYSRTTNAGFCLKPRKSVGFLVVFCDEVNLPAVDKFGTQNVISLLRQLLESGGFWHPKLACWVALQRVVFAAACNPPTHAGRTPLPLSLLRHSTLLHVPSPGPASLQLIYEARLQQQMSEGAQGAMPAGLLAEAMVSVYSQCKEHLMLLQERFPHYVCSARELTRWVDAFHFVVASQNDERANDADVIILIWLHEGLRIWQDRLVHDSDRKWVESCLLSVAAERFRPFSTSPIPRNLVWSSIGSKSRRVELTSLSSLQASLQNVFLQMSKDAAGFNSGACELVPCADISAKVAAAVRVLDQSGHLLLLGEAGSGKSVVAAIAARVSLCQLHRISLHSAFSDVSLADEIRKAVEQAVRGDGRVLVVMEEAQLVPAAAVESLNSLLTGGDVLHIFFDEIQREQLLADCRRLASASLVPCSSDSQVLRFFRRQLHRNLQLCFTMTTSADASNMSSTALNSPALFNRCTILWFSPWHHDSLLELAHAQLLPLISLLMPPPSQHQASSHGSPEKKLQRNVLACTALAVVQIHAVAAKLSSSVGGVVAQSLNTRSLVDFLYHLSQLLREKRKDLTDKEAHLSVGVEKVVSAEQQISQLRHQLAGKTAELERKQRDAEQKLKQMAVDRTAVQRKKAEAEALILRLDERASVMAERKKQAQVKLDEVEPLVEEAKIAVKSIRKSQLDDLRAMPHPPAAVKLTLEGVCLLLHGIKPQSWQAILSIVRRNDFINSILNFHMASLDPLLSLRLQSEYLDSGALSFEAVNRASKACGPLRNWLFAAVKFGQILSEAQPIRDELYQLEEDSASLAVQLEAVQANIHELEMSLSSLTSEYNELIGSCDATQSEISSTQTAIQRAASLVAGLGSESKRWEQEKRRVQEAHELCLGDCLLAAAALSYWGVFQSAERDQLLREWKAALSSPAVAIPFSSDSAGFTPSLQEEQLWLSLGLPPNLMAFQNAAMILRSQRPPLLVDPTEQLTKFAMNYFSKSGDVKVVSAYDERFETVVETAVRFGLVCIVRDAEHFNGTLAPILTNNVVTEGGGRRCLQLQDQLLEMAPSFRLILVTHGLSTSYPKSIVSKAVVVNSAVSASWLEATLLNQIVSFERADVEQRRLQALRLQGDCQLRVEVLESQLLAALSKSAGSIVEDTKVEETLSRIQNDAAQAEAKSKELQQAIADLELVREEYTPLSTLLAQFFLLISSMKCLHPLYHFSTSTLLSHFNHALVATQGHNSTAATNQQQRIDFLLSRVVCDMMRRVSATLHYRHFVPLALNLVALLMLLKWPELATAVVEVIHQGKELSLEVNRSEGHEGAQGDGGMQNLQKILSLLPSDSLVTSQVAFLVERHKLMLDDVQMNLQPQDLQQPYSDLGGDDDEDNSLFKTFAQLLFSATFSPQHLHQCCLMLAATCLHSPTIQHHHPSQDLPSFRTFFTSHASSSKPLLLACVPGCDATTMVQLLAQEMGQPLIEVAMGAAESIDAANEAITVAAEKGCWLLLLNVHLARQWLPALLLHYRKWQVDSSFRLVVTAEVLPSSSSEAKFLPSAFIEACDTLIFEPPSGLKGSLQKSVGRFLSEKMPPHLFHLKLSLCWLHAVMEERLHFSPVGWEAVYEFTDEDLAWTIKVLDAWTATSNQQKMRAATSDQTTILLHAARIILLEVVYGPKMLTANDHLTLTHLVSSLICPEALLPGFNFCECISKSPMSKMQNQQIANKDSNTILPPLHSDLCGWLEWLQSLPTECPPQWLGLAYDAKKLRYSRVAQLTFEDASTVLNSSLKLWS